MGVEAWRRNRTFSTGDPLTDRDAVGLAAYVYGTLQPRLRQRSLETIDALEEEVDQLRSDNAFLALRVDATQADTLKELQHAYNTISVLVAQLGGEVSIHQDNVYDQVDSRLTIEDDENGNIVLKSSIL